MSVYLSYAWEGEHLDAVRALNDELVANGISTSFQERFAGDLDQGVQQGIDNCDLVVVLLTHAYLEQVLSPTVKRSLRSWARREYYYTKQNRDRSGVVYAVLDPALLEGRGLASVRELAGDGDGDFLVDFATFRNVNDIIEALEKRREMYARAQGRRTGSGASGTSGGPMARTRPARSMQETPVDWEHAEHELVYPDGALKYRGTVLFGEMHGEGAYFYHRRNGAQADGNDDDEDDDDEADNEDGRRSSDKYTGEFANDYFHGKGTYYCAATDSTFVGQFRFDKREGPGESFWDRGHTLRFRGTYVAGVRDGVGVAFKRDGSVDYEGLWSRGELITRVEVAGGGAKAAAKRVSFGKRLSRRIARARTSSSASSASTSSDASDDGQNPARHPRKPAATTMRVGRFKVQQ